MNKLVNEMDVQITAIHRAFGAPGDYGYSTRQGIALYELYKFQAELRAFIAKSVPPNEGEEK